VSSIDRRALERRLAAVDAALARGPGDLALLFERAQIHDRLGDRDRARLGYIAVLQRDPAHFGALNDLGLLLFHAGLRQEAFTCYAAAVAKHPENAIGHANLAFVYLRAGEAQKALEHYERAVALDAANVEAQRGLALALAALGQDDRAREQRDAAFGASPVIVQPYRGEGRPVRVLVVVSASSGNTHTDRFFDDRTFAVTKLVAEYADAVDALPAHDLVFNAVGDADLCGPLLQRVSALLERTAAPVLNLPQAITRTTRAENAARLRALDGVRTARTELRSRDAIAGPFPVLVRSLGYHTGKYFEKIDRAEDLAAALTRLPGDPLLEIEYLDVRSADSKVRKYRAIFVGDAIYPLHLAVSDDWKVHYFSAEMLHHADRRAEDERFLRDMAGTLGARAMAALERIRATLGLDFGGVDFALDRDGTVVVFEANATMVVPPDEGNPVFAYRREPIARIERAIHTLFLKTAQAARSKESA
jgi:tetratricopeptide (TPR) repeat protein